LLINGRDNRLDGDIVYLVSEKRGHPKFKRIDLLREPNEISSKDVETLLSKSSRCKRGDLRDWLPTYFDDVPIGPATYTIRWNLHNMLYQFRDSDHPMHQAWESIAPESIDLMEFVMDIKKGDWTEEEISRRLRYINSKTKEINTAKKEGDWFAKTITSGHIDDIYGFINTFSTLQEYVNLVTLQR
jgi:hypothetical protein